MPFSGRAMALALSLAAAAAAPGCSGTERAGRSADPWSAARGDGSAPTTDRLESPAMVQAAIRAAEAASLAGDHRTAADLLRRAYATRPTPQVAALLGREARLSGDPRGAVAFIQEAVRRHDRSAPLLIELGRSALAGGFLPEAEQALAEVAALPSPPWEAAMIQGAVRARRGDTAGAGEAFRRAAASAPTNRDRNSAEANAALVRADSGDIRGAISELEVIAARPDVSPKVLANLALLRGVEGDRSGFISGAAQAGLSPADIEGTVRWLDDGRSDETSAPGRGARTRR